jgi:2,3-bisphosphoglycerate-independent phosphoglycerate mutase
MIKKPSILIILDGWGENREPDGNAIHAAFPAFFLSLQKQYAHAVLSASGASVGLPDQMISNSAVGHLTIGAGRIIKQPITQFLAAIQNKTFDTTYSILDKKLAELAQQKKNVHIISILSEAGIHGHIKLLESIIAVAAKYPIQIYIHAILDGRDTPPFSGIDYITELLEYCALHKNTHLATLHGRFFALDRDYHWDRVLKTVETMIAATPYASSWKEYLDDCYKNGITDEFIPPVSLFKKSVIAEGDGIIFATIREDRSRELVSYFLNAPDLPLKNDNRTPPPKIKINIPPFAWCITGISLHPQLDTLPLLKRDAIENSLVDVLCHSGLSILEIAETEKYAHVTYFISGGHEKPYQNEKRVLVQSLPVAHLAAHPEMRAYEITKTILSSLEKNEADFYIVNFANADMVGHTGNFEAIKKAITVLDDCLSKIVPAFMERDGNVFITGDHGNADTKITKDDKPITGHSAAPVPFIHISQQTRDIGKLPLNTLADIAPYILKVLDIPIPKEMIKRESDNV